MCLIISFSAQAQSTIQFQKELSPFKTDSTYFLNNWVVETTIKVFIDGEIIPTNKWNFNSEAGAISFQNLPDSLSAEEHYVSVQFHAYPFTLKRNYQAREPIELDSALFINPDSLDEEISTLRRQSTFDESNLQQTGSLSRGVIVGSNQDFSLESGLNFELHGALTDNININASLTDQNLPIQPDGTTQNLREFDKVFIQVEGPNTAVEMGDVDISLEQSTFAKLNRRLQGAAGYTNSRFGNYTAAASVVRGTYKTIRFNGEDGVQGPYRLTGENNEEFVIILAGTERVYINGQRVQRGAEYDYIIDYGLGEVFFTNNLLIKDETRIVIEYEYVEQNFNRTLVAAEGGSKFFDGRLQIGATVIRQADGNDLLSQRTLTEEDINVLRAAGDDIEGATMSGARIADETERENYVLYAEIDTVINGENFTIYDHQPTSEDAIYRVRFSDVGQNQGSYRRISGAINGLLYEWVGPGNGNYEPFEQLPAPQEHQMAAIRGRFGLSDKFELFGEWAVSDYDQNRFSPLDDDENTDMSYESGLRMNAVESPIGLIEANIRRRYSGRNFEFFERTRDVEFDRKWNITRTEQSRESINESDFSLSPTEYTTIGAEAGYVERDDFMGMRQATSLVSNEPNIVNLAYNQDFVQSQDDSISVRGSWFRQNGLLSRDFDAGKVTITPYFGLEQERRIQRNLDTDSLANNSHQFYEVGPGLRFVFTDLTLDANLVYRSENALLQNRLTKEFDALEQRYQVAYQPSVYFKSTNEVRFRYKDYTDAFSEMGETNSRSLFLKSTSNYRSKNNFIDGELFYQANTQRQAILQEIFVRVGSANGQYVWQDINEDNVQQVDEFFPEIGPNEGTFIREFLPSDELFPVVFLNFRTFNTFRPFSFFYDADDEDSLLPGITLRSRINISENSTTQNIADVYLLKLNTFRNDSNTVQGHLYWEIELDVLNNLDKADFRIGFNQNRALNQRTNESISTYSHLYYFYSGLEVGEQSTLTLNGFNGVNKNISNRLTSRNYNIETFTIVPGIEATINRSWNTGINASYTYKEDRFPTQTVAAKIFKLTNTHRAFLWKKLQTDFRLELRRTIVDGNSSTYGTYELTEGTGEGTNLLWTLNSTYRISDLIRFSLSYDGRTVENQPSIHTIKLVMSAVF